jgi:hypothetical protein
MRFGRCERSAASRGALSSKSPGQRAMQQWRPTSWRCPAAPGAYGRDKPNCHSADRRFGSRPAFLKMRLRASLNTSSPLRSRSISPTITGPVVWQEIAELDGSSNHFPCCNLSMRLRSKYARWHVTPWTFGSWIASTTMSLPTQSVFTFPTVSAQVGVVKTPTARKTATANARSNITCRPPSSISSAPMPINHPA